MVLSAYTKEECSCRPLLTRTLTMNRINRNNKFEKKQTETKEIVQNWIPDEYKQTCQMLYQGHLQTKAMCWLGLIFAIAITIFIVNNGHLRNAQEYRELAYFWAGFTLIPLALHGLVRLKTKQVREAIRLINEQRFE
jgi:surface polysaccharide O-acyltransferase-like enzyme